MFIKAVLIVLSLVLIYAVYQLCATYKLLIEPVVKFKKQYGWVIKPKLTPNCFTSFDFYKSGEPVTIPAKTTITIDTHTYIKIPKNFKMTIHADSDNPNIRSYIVACSKYELNSAYKDTIKIDVYNCSETPIKINTIEKFAQGVIRKETNK